MDLGRVLHEEPESLRARGVPVPHELQQRRVVRDVGVAYGLIRKADLLDDLGC